MAHDSAAIPGSVPALRRLVVNADDFGRSPSINTAVVRAHQEGVLTTASLMVNEPHAAEAVQLARQNPRLGVGLHLVLLCGRSALPSAQIPGLVDNSGNFTNSPAGAGFRYFLNRDLRSELRAEIRAQFARFRATGLELDHVNGHLHLHLHPTVMAILMLDASELGIHRARLTFDPLWLNLRLASGRLVYRLSHALIFHILSARAQNAFRKRAIRHTHAVFGLLQDGLVDEEYLLRLLPHLPNGNSELYSHPSLDTFKHELDALVSARVRGLVNSLGIELIRYQDL